MRRSGEWAGACQVWIKLCSTSLGERGGVWTRPTLPRRLAPLRPLSTSRPPALIAPEQDAARHPRPLAASPLPPAPKRPRRVRVRVEVGRQGTPRPDHGRPVVQRDVPLGRQEGQASHGQRQDPRTRLRRLALEGEPSSSPLRMLLLLLSRELTPAVPGQAHHAPGQGVRAHPRWLQVPVAERCPASGPHRARTGGGQVEGGSAFSGRRSRGMKGYHGEDSNSWQYRVVQTGAPRSRSLAVCARPRRSTTATRVELTSLPPSPHSIHLPTTSSPTRSVRSSLLSSPHTACAPVEHARRRPRDDPHPPIFAYCRSSVPWSNRGEPKLPLRSSAGFS